MLPFDTIAKALEQQGVAIVSDFFPADLVTRLRVECQQWENSGRLHKSAMGKKSSEWVDHSLRGDSIGWWEESALTPNQQAVWKLWQSVTTALNQRLYLGLQAVEAHYACYPPGAGYVRHQDRFAADDARTISFVGYLNDEWRKADGGELWLYPTPSSAEPNFSISPQSGTAVIFLSELAHEVKPATRARRSVVAWFKRNRPIG